MISIGESYYLKKISQISSIPVYFYQVLGKIDFYVSRNSFATFLDLSIHKVRSYSHLSTKYLDTTTQVSGQPGNWCIYL